MDKFFAAFGKVVLVAILLGGAGYAAYTLGKSAPALPTNALQSDKGVPPTSASVITPTPTTQAATTVTAGLHHTGGILLPAYTVSVPEGWTASHHQDLTGSPSDTLAITNGSYTITISQGAFGGGVCVYPGEPDVEGPEARYSAYTEFAGADGSTYRRGTTAGTPSFTNVCQKSKTGTVYGNITSYGHVSYTTPASQDSTILAQMDTIVATLKAQ